MERIKRSSLEEVLVIQNFLFILSERKDTEIAEIDN